MGRTNGSPSPEYNTDEDRSFFHVILPVHPAFLESTKVRRSKTKVRKKSTFSSEEIMEQFGENALKIILLIQEDETITAAEMAQSIGISSRGVEKSIAKMRREALLDREGATKSGKWIILITIDG